MSLIRSVFDTDFDRMFADPFFHLTRRTAGGEPFGMLTKLDQGFFQPRVDVWDSGEAIRVHADLPGVPKEKVKAEIHNNNLTIEGETEDIKDFENMTSRVRERRYGKFARVIGLPTGIDASNVKAEFKNGVLEMTIPKSQETQAKKIEIS
jgi:HSP20 family protein